MNEQNDSNESRNRRNTILIAGGIITITFIGFIVLRNIYRSNELSITFTRKESSGQNYILLPINNIIGTASVTYLRPENNSSISVSTKILVENQQITPFFSSSGTTTVSIRGDFRHLGYKNNRNFDSLITNSAKITAIENINDFDNINDLSYLFFKNDQFNQSINTWNVENCLDMSSMFNGATAFNGDISSWNVGRIRNMSDMFEGATAFNGDISSWNVGRCTNMSFMFNGATAFNNGSIGLSADVRNSLLNSKFNATINVTTFNNFATGAKLIEDLNDSEITDFYNELFITEEE